MMVSEEETLEEKGRRLLAAHCEPLVLNDQYRAGRKSIFSLTGTGSLAGRDKERKQQSRATKKAIVEAAVAAAAADGLSSSLSSSSSLSLSSSSSLGDAEGSDVSIITAEGIYEIVTKTKTVQETKSDGTQIVTTHTITRKRQSALFRLS
jgi:hypothetical protein